MRTWAILTIALSSCTLPDRGDRIHLPDAPHPITVGDNLLDEDLVGDIDARVRDLLEPLEVPALGLALVRDGAVIYSAAYGWADLSTEAAATPQTPFLLASVSKTFLGVAALQARDDGLLSLDAPIDSLTGLSVDNPHTDGETITLRHMLTHHSGLEDSRVYDRSYAEGDPEVTLGDFLAGYVEEGGEYYHRKNYAARQPGEAFAYSNVGAGLAAYGVEVASGSLYSDYVAENILVPLGMVDSAFRLDALRTEPAVLYGTTLVGGGWKPYTPYGFPTYPDGLMRSSAADMGAYVADLQGGDVLLSADSLDEMLAVDASLGTDEDGQALVWVRREMGGRTLLGHNGGDFGASAELWIDREAGIGIVVMLNADYIREDAWQAIFDLESDLLDLIDPK